VFYLPGTKINTDTDLRYSFTANNYGIFGKFEEGDRAALKELIQDLSNFRLSYQLKSAIPLGTIENVECFNWMIYQNFDFTARNHPIVNLKMEKSFCSDGKAVLGNFWGRYLWLHLLSIILCSISLALNIKYIFEIVQSFNKLKDKYKKHQNSEEAKRYRAHLRRISQKNKSRLSGEIQQKNPRIQSDRTLRSSDKYNPVLDFEDDDVELPDWNELTNMDKLKLFSGWSLVIIISNILVIIGSLFLMLNTKTVNETGELIIGLGAMLTWCSLIKFYENLKGYNVITSTLENSAEIFFKALAGVFPVFIGFGVLGTCIFWRSHRFNSLSTTLFSLFAVMNGDMIFDCWHDIDSIDYFLAQLYLYSFIFISVCVVLNAFIVIIEDGYIMQKYFSRTDWTKGVNQRSTLHLAEMMVHQNNTDGGGSGGRSGGGHEDFSEGSFKTDPGKERSKSVLNKSKLQVPMINGAPIPHDGDPFIRLQKRSKKDIKSRIALVKMLKHEKAEVEYQKRMQRISQDISNKNKNGAKVHIEYSEESKDLFPIKEMLESEVAKKASTPEGIVRQITELVILLDNMRTQEMQRIHTLNNNADQELDINDRFRSCYEKIKNIVNQNQDKIDQN